MEITPQTPGHADSWQNASKTAVGSWGPSFLLGNEWPFKPNLEVVTYILSKNSVEDTIGNSKPALTSIWKWSEPVFFWEKYSSLTKLQQCICFMLSLLPKHKHFSGPTAQIINSAVLAIAKDKLLLLANSETFPVEFKQLQSGIPVKGSCRIAGESLFIGPGDIIRSTGRIQRLAEISFETKLSIIVDSRHLLMKLFLRHLHSAHIINAWIICVP